MTGHVHSWTPFYSHGGPDGWDCAICGATVWEGHEVELSVLSCKRVHAEFVVAIESVRNLESTTWHV